MAEKSTTSSQRSLDDILKTLRDHLPELKQRYDVTYLGVFGSYVRGQQRKGSDLDVLVEFEDDARPGLLEFIGLQQELGDILGIKVDLVEKKGLKPHIGRRILEEVIYLPETEGGTPRDAIPKGDVSLADRRRELRDYLKDILDNVGRVEQWVRGTDFDSFSSDWQKAYAVLHALLLIGEAAGKVPSSLRRRYPEVPWRSIIGLRNVVAHEYFAVQLPRIWQVIHEELPRLRDVMARILAELEQEERDA